MRLGELLVHLGRVTADDVTRALEYQRQHGGYMGDALIRLGALTREELRWTLADQYDIPFVRLRPESIDRGLAAMVPAAWAREHHMLPVLRDGDQITVVIGDVTDLEKLEEVRRMTGAGSVQPALSSPEAIQELVDSVYAPAVAPPARLTDFLAEALAHGAAALGVSVRRGGAVGWYRVVETVHRPLLDDWEAELAAALAPFPPLTGSGTPALREWRGLLQLAGQHRSVDCTAVGQGCALEWAARVRARLEDPLVAAQMPERTAVALRARLSAGPLVVRVHAPDDAALNDPVALAVAALPALLLGSGARAIHLSDQAVPVGGGTLALTRDGTPELAALEAFSVQALTLDVARFGPAEAQAARRVAPFVAVRARAGADFGADLELRLEQDADGLTWSLGAEHGED